MAKGVKQVKPWAYSEGDLRARIKRFSETPEGSVVFGSGGDTDLSNITTKISSSYANHNNLAGDLAIEGTLNVSGNLTVNGTTTTVNSTVTTIDDPIMTLGGDTAPGSDDNKDRGIEFRWHNGSSAKVGFFGFDDSTGYFSFVPDATNTSEVFSGDKGTLDIGGMFFDGRLSQSVNGGSNVFMSDVIIGQKNNSTYYNLYVSGGIVGGTGDFYQLSQSSLAGAQATNVLTDDLILSKINGGAAANLRVSGSITSAGNMTIGADADGTDRTITFGHSTLKTTIGIDDDQDVFAINTDNAFEAANDFEINASGDVTLANGDLYVDKIRRATDSSTTTKILLNDEVVKLYAGHSSNEVMNISNTAVAVAGNISGSGKGYFEKDVEIADDLKVSGSTTLGSGASNTFVINSAGRVSGSSMAIFEGDIVTADNIAATGSVTAGTGLIIGSDADGTDRTITFGHSTLKSIIGIDDSADVFAINTDDAFETANDLQIDANGDVTLGNGNLIIGADADGTDRTITFGHSSLKTIIGIDDNVDVFAINTDASFESGNDFEIDSGGNTTISHGRLQVLGTEGVMSTRISGSGKGYFEKDVEMADNLYISGNIGVGTSSTLSASINTNGNIRDVKYSNGAGARSSLRLAKAKGTEASPAVVTDAHSVGQVEFSAYDGANYVECASIVAKISGTPGSDDMPGSLTFATTADGAKESSDRMVITETGNIYVSGNVKVPDDKRLYFGTNNDAYIEYEEDNQDFLVISGSSAGMVLSGTTVQIRGTLEGASPLKIAGGIEIVAKQGETTHMKFGDDIKQYYGSGDDTYVQFKNATSQYLEISGSSTGTVMSGSKLAVTGKMGVGVSIHGDNITHGITLPNTDDVYGKIKANAYTTYSSLRYKDNIEPIQNAMAKIRNLSGVTYNWKTTNSSDIGFIAEEVGKVMPEIVEWESDGVNAQAMDYTKIIPVLVEALKEQQAEIDSQKKIINELSEKIGKTKVDKE